MAVDEIQRPSRCDVGRFPGPYESLLCTLNAVTEIKVGEGPNGGSGRVDC